MGSALPFLRLTVLVESETKILQLHRSCNMSLGHVDLYPSFLCIQSVTVRITLFALDSLLTAITQSSAYLVKRSPLVSSSLSISFSMMFDSSGDRFPPYAESVAKTPYIFGIYTFLTQHNTSLK